MSARTCLPAAAALAALLIALVALPGVARPAPPTRTPAPAS